MTRTPYKNHRSANRRHTRFGNPLSLLSKTISHNSLTPSMQVRSKQVALYSKQTGRKVHDSSTHQRSETKRSSTGLEL